MVCDHQFIIYTELPIDQIIHNIISFTLIIGGDAIHSDTPKQKDFSTPNLIVLLDLFVI